MEGLMRHVDGYCERTDFTYWSEPVNALTNIAFLIAAFVVWRRLGRDGPVMARVLCMILGVIGIGSFLFHTFATAWAGLADTLPIAVFVLTYLFVANHDYWGMKTGWALVATALFVPYAALMIPVFSALPFFAVSAPYWPVPLLIAIYAAALSRRLPAVARGLGIGAGVLVVSLGFRSVDESVCAAFPLGTHFMWHILNAVMLGWMIEVYRAHCLRRTAAAGQGRGGKNSGSLSVKRHRI